MSNPPFNAGNPAPQLENDTILNNAPPGPHVGTDEDVLSEKGDATSRSSVNDESSQAKLLLEALQNYVLPLIHSIKVGQKTDVQHTPMTSPEGVKFLSALHELVSSMIVGSQMNRSNIIEVDLEDANLVTGMNHLEEASKWLWTPLVISQDIHPLDYLEEAIDPLDYLEAVADWMWNIETSEAPGENLRRIQTALRERIESTMPIRLLHFRPSEQHESKLQITLLDRSGVYDYLKAVLDIEYSEEEFQEAVANSNSGPEAKNNVIKNWVNLYARYAILSHTWIRDSGAEVTYSIWNSGRFNTNQSGYQKLANFCKTAWIDHGIVFGWMDTICINKESSSELDESIRSMYKWYRNAHVCITYLAHTGFRSDMHNDAWFTRGWTFQELLAPRSMKFYNKDWQRLNDDLRRSDKDDDFIIHEIQQATTLTYAELQCDAKDLPISRKMKLAAKRAVQREEDTAYSLMGICNVSISIAYGEGANRAFFRLIMEILNSSDNVLDVFNCSLSSPSSSDTNRQYTSYILPWGPLAYSHRSRELEGLTPQRPLEPLMLTHLGLRISVLLIPGGDEDYTTFIDDPIGDYYAKIQFMKGEGGKKLQKYTYNLLDKGLGIRPQFDGSTWTLDNSDPSPPLPVTSEDRASENLVFSPNSMNNIELPVELLATLKASNTDEEPPTHWADNLSNQGHEAELDTPNPWPVDEFGQEYLEPGIGWTVADTTFGILNIGGDKTNIEVPSTCLAIGFQSHWSVEWEATSTYVSKHDTDEPVVFKLQKRDTDISLNSAGYSIRRSELAKHGMKLATMYL